MLLSENQTTSRRTAQRSLQQRYMYIFPPSFQLQLATTKQLLLALSRHRSKLLMQYIRYNVNS